MKRILSIAAIVIGMAASAAFAELPTITIGAGQPGRGYDKNAHKMVERMKDGVIASVVNFEGSDAISKAVCSGEVDVGITQIDGIYARQKDGCTLKVVGIYGTEHVYLMVPPGSEIGQLSDLTAKSHIQVDTIGSGTDLYWQTIVGIENGPDGNQSGWQKAQPVNDIAVMAQTNASFGTINAVLFVTGTDSTDVKTLYDAGWTLVPVYDKDLNDLVFNNTSLYPAEDAEIVGTGGVFSGDESADSYAVRSYIVMNAAAAGNRAVLNEVARASVALTASTK